MARICIVTEQQRVRVFDNGSSTATFISGNSEKDTLVVTFDPFGHLNPDAAGFGEKVLTGEGYDVIAFQKRIENYYQDLSREDVRSVLGSFLPPYRKLVFYGCSVGAYAALYFGAPFEADILAISPRVSSHAVYCQHLNLSGAHARLHQHGPIHDGTPVLARNVVILYDSVSALQRAAVPDTIYMDEHILPAFPSADVRPLRHTGHPSTTPLAETHQLRPMLFQFLRTGSVDLSAYHRLKSASPTYLVNFSAWLLKKKRLDWAVSVGDKALRLAPRSPQVVFHRVRLLLTRGDFIGARHTALQGLEAEARKQSHHLHLIATFEEAGDDEGVLQIIKHAVDLNPALLPAPKRRSLIAKASTLLEKVKRLEEALSWALEAIYLDEPNVHLLQRVAHLAYRLSRWQQSLDYLDQAIELQNDNGYSHWLRGLALGKLGRIAEAQASLEKALASRPGENYWKLQLAELYLANWKQAEARQLIKDVAASDHLSVSLLTYKAELLVKLADDRAAIETLGKASAMAPSNINIQKRLVSAYRSVGQIAEALKQADHALVCNPNHPHLLRLRDEILQEMNFCVSHGHL
jgi:tetratricopeptide (TPR) repeat protein